MMLGTISGENESLRLIFCVLSEDPLMRASPAVQRAVQESIDALKKEGHECVEFVVPNMVEMARIFVALTAADGHQTLLSHLGPDDKVCESCMIISSVYVRCVTVMHLSQKDATLFLMTLGPRLPGKYTSTPRSVDSTLTVKTQFYSIRPEDCGYCSSHDSRRSDLRGILCQFEGTNGDGVLGGDREENRVRQALFQGGKHNQ